VNLVRTFAFVLDGAVHRTDDSEPAAIPDVPVHAAVESHLSSLGDQKLAVTGAVDRCEDTLGNDYVRDRAVSREPGRDSRANPVRQAPRGKGSIGSLVGLALRAIGQYPSSRRARPRWC
jgi:hypothetical protein